jgi:iron(III) transport system ATP-binding protein
MTLVKKLGITCILVSHDALDILSWADTILVMKDGKIIQQDAPLQVYKQPVNEYCAGLFGDYNLIDINQAKTFASIPGIQFKRKTVTHKTRAFQFYNGRE